MFKCYLNNHIDLPTIFIPLSTGSIWTLEGCNENGSFRFASGNMGWSTTVEASTPNLLGWILLPACPQEIVEFKARGNCASLFGVYCHTGIADTFLSGWGGGVLLLCTRMIKAHRWMMQTWAAELQQPNSNRALWYLPSHDGRLFPIMLSGSQCWRVEVLPSKLSQHPPAGSDWFSRHGVMWHQDLDAKHT